MGRPRAPTHRSAGSPRARGRCPPAAGGDLLDHARGGGSPRPLDGRGHAGRRRSRRPPAGVAAAAAASAARRSVRSASRASAARPASIVSVARSIPSSIDADGARHQQRGGRVEHHDIAPRPRLAVDVARPSGRSRPACRRRASRSRRAGTRASGRRSRAARSPPARRGTARRSRRAAARRRRRRG